MNNHTIKIVLASPSDVAEERRLLAEIVSDLNVHCGRFLDVHLDLYRWEDIPPSMHPGGPQALIDENLEIDAADIVIGVFWKRFGTLTRSGERGTEHEVRLAYRRYLENRKPLVMLYFNEQVHEANADELEQMLLVRRFRDEFEAEGIVSPYRGTEDFATQIRNHLVNLISRRAAANIRPESVPCAVAALPRFVRAEGVAELVGEIALTFPRRPDLDTVVSNIHVYFNTNITNTIDTQGTAHEALLIVDDAGTGNVGTVIRGRLQGVNAILFESVKLCFAGDGGVLNLRLVGIRVNAFALGQSGINPGIRAFVKIEPPSSRIGVVNPEVTVGLRYPSFGFSTGVTTFDRTVGANPEFAMGRTAELQLDFVCTFHENVPDAFKTKRQESVTGTYRKPMAEITEASSGTVLGLRFTDVPEGVSIYVGKYDTGALRMNPSARLQSTTDIVEVSSPVGMMVLLPKAGKTVAAEWEWINDDPAATIRVDVISFAVAIVAKPGDANCGECRVEGALSPFSFTGTASSRAPVPRFGATLPSHVAFVFR